MTDTSADDTQRDIRPIVGRPVSSRSVWVFAGATAIAAVLLFSALEARRSTNMQNRLVANDSDAGGFIAAPPELAIPVAGAGDDAYVGAVPAAPLLPREPQYRLAPPPVVQRAYPQPTAPAPRAPDYFNPGISVPNYRPAPILPTQPTPTPAPERNGQPTDRLAGNRVTATRLLNPSSTVPQGTVVQAVLETALDSNRPGFARAVVSRDVRSFDGSAILIPRGSRLFGEYKADLADGQNRAFVNWQKLTRPDGVQIVLDSPAADPLGRAGVKGQVDTHFAQRFGEAVLQTILDVGVAVASRRASANNTVIIGSPNGVTAPSFATNSRNLKPTLSVLQGSRVSVFVARDLDFSTAP